MDFNKIIKNFKLKPLSHKALSLVMLLASIMFILSYFIKILPSGSIASIVGCFIITAVTVYFTVMSFIEEPKVKQ